MEQILRSIPLNDTSYDVMRLHQALRALGIKVATSESKAGAAGKDTLAKVRALQKRLSVEVDDSVLVDNDTALAIAGELERRGYTSVRRTFTLIGSVRNSLSAPQKRQQLLAFDVDLKGASIYRTVESLQEIKKNGGFEFIGNATSDARGRYKIRFYDWQYNRAELKKADVVVYAVDGSKIIGRSQLVDSVDYEEKGIVRNLTVVITGGDVVTEYQRIMDPLNRFLKLSKIKLSEISDSEDQLLFLARELEIAQGIVRIVTKAEALSSKSRGAVNHELLYGLGRQGISLTWPALFKTNEDELRTVLERAASNQVIQEFADDDISSFLAEIKARSADSLLEGENSVAGASLNEILSYTLQDKNQRLSFVDALHSFRSSDRSEFWSSHLRQQPEFREKPELVDGLLLSQQLTALTGNHQPLVRELQVNRSIGSVADLMKLEEADWRGAIEVSAVPDFIPGATEEERVGRYADSLKSALDAAFPTLRIATMVERNQVGIDSARVSQGISSFLANNQDFDFALSRVHDFSEAIERSTDSDSADVLNELKSLQRTFQISPNPQTLSALRELKLDSASQISSFARNVFVKRYAKALGGERVAFAVHQRAAHISARAEMTAMRALDYSQMAAPVFVLNSSALSDASATMTNLLPNYAELFGSPDMCECKHCSSVYGAAAYFVDLLRFLWRGDENDLGDTPLDVLEKRRPDLRHLQLTCENSLTLIPYTDLATEVMERYVAHSGLAGFVGYDTGEATEDELRASQQHFDIEAYRVLKDSLYPFTLPYHQPLDLIRTYSEHLKSSRYEVLKAVTPDSNDAEARAIAAEALKLSEERYSSIVLKGFDGVDSVTQTHSFFGYDDPGDLEDLSEVRECLRRTGVSYVELVDLLNTMFINPHQHTLDFVEQLFSYASISASDIYEKLAQVADGTLDPDADADIQTAISGYNSENESEITSEEFRNWVVGNFSNFQEVVTLFESSSMCALDSTSLRTIRSIYEDEEGSGVTESTWSRTHRFIRLWRALGWTIHEIDLMLTALGNDDITDDTLSQLEFVKLMADESRRPLNQLATIFGTIDTYGDKPLYKKLFLNKSVRRIDSEVFAADAWGHYFRNLAVAEAPIENHQSALLAAFGITEEDFAAIIEHVEIIEGGVTRKINPSVDALGIEILSVIYRYVVFAKATKTHIPDMCLLTTLFQRSPFSIWDVTNAQFTSIDPESSYEFYKLLNAVKTAKFDAESLSYIIDGSLRAESTIGLSESDSLNTGKAISDAFQVVEQEHPTVIDGPITAELISSKLTLTFAEDVVSLFMSLLDGGGSFETTTEGNLDVSIPDELSDRCTYTKGSGRLTFIGVMSDDERDTLKGLDHATVGFQGAVDELYGEPELFVSENFSGIFSDLNEANEELLNHPAQPASTAIEEKLSYVYDHFVPKLQEKLRRDVITQHLAALIGLSETAATVLIKDQFDTLIADLSSQGFSASYFTDRTWTNTALERTDGVIDFVWGDGSPDPLIPADSFSVRWQAYLSAPASGEYTLVVTVAEDDEEFKLYIDDELILEKAAAEAVVSKEVVLELNPAQLPKITLEYAESANSASVRLEWKTDITAKEVIPLTSVYPTEILDGFVEKATQLHRAAQFITGFGISETELAHFRNYGPDFGAIDFGQLTAENWILINDYIELRNSVPQSQAMLTDVFTLAKRSEPAPTVDELTELTQLATAWENEGLSHLVVTHFNLSVDDFKNHVSLAKIATIMELSSKSGMSAETVVEWGAIETDFDILHNTALSLTHAVKGKYEEEDWLQLAGDLTDDIRKRQQAALVSYLLVRPEIQSAAVEDADGLFEYLLIDVQMSPCMKTSRIVQASAAIQMFVNRCLLNLESDLSGDSEHGVSPAAIDKDRWEWMKNYRVWEANRKVFLYPENWLEPEWRNDRSEFFRELESFLTQNDITDRNVEQAFRSYLKSLNEVANLEVCGMYREEYDGGELKYLHVFGRTHNAPYTFFYRTWDEYQKWSPWEKVSVDIRSVERGNYSGAHVMPMVWKKRLFLFWPEFMEVSEAPSYNSEDSIEDVGKNGSIGAMEPEKKWEIRLAWSEYFDGKWTPKQVSKEFISTDIDILDSQFESGLTFSAGVSDNILYIRAWNKKYYPDLGYFRMTDIQSSVEVNYYSISTYYEVSGYDAFDDYDFDFMKRSIASSQLKLTDNTYLNNATTHSMLEQVNRDRAETDYLDFLSNTLKHPFFFSDKERTYFVRPVSVSLIDKVRNPDLYLPFVPEFELYVDPKKPIDPPVVDPGTVIGGSGFPPIDPELGGGGIPPIDPVALGGGMVRRFASGADDRLSVRSRRGAVRSAEVNLATAGEPVTHLSDDGSSERATVIDLASVNRSFSGIDAIDVQGLLNASLEKGLEFHTFYHPHSSDYVENLNRGGLSRGSKSSADYPAGLMESDTEIESDDGSTFEDVYDPNFNYGLVQKPSDFDSRTYYKENVCFDPKGANSKYNWELFFHAPLYVATRLSKNNKFEEAMKWFHFIFDPTTDQEPGDGESEISRYWKFLPFKSEPTTSIEEFLRSLEPNTNPGYEDPIIGEWRDNMFDPHLVASNRPLAYMKNVVLKYVQNITSWADSLFRQFTRESVYEALQLYVLANHILGPKPEFVPHRGKVKAETYDSLEDKWDDFSNALVELENMFPYSSEVSVEEMDSGPNLLGVGSALYFCIPSNDQLLDLWDLAADRLYKIRNCRDIDGVKRELALFAPPIDPGALINALSQGLSLGSILADLSSPPPIYRFTFLIQRANDFCSDVKALGAATLAAIERKDAEGLSRLRASHETQMQELMTAIRERQILEARTYKEQLERSRDLTEAKLEHYRGLLGVDAAAPPDSPTISANLTADSQLPADTSIPALSLEVDDGLSDSTITGVKLIDKESEDLSQTRVAKDKTGTGSTIDAIGGLMNFIPSFSGMFAPLGTGGSISYGGSNLAGGASGIARFYHGGASDATSQALIAGKISGYIRREQDWTLQANLAAQEIIQLDKQITIADLRIQIAEKELENHNTGIEQAEEVELFLKDKFTSEELYQWLKEQLFAVYKQSYNLAYDMSHKAQKAYQYELGVESAGFIQYGYWDSSQEGLTSGEKLQLSLRQLEKSYLEENRRELELTKTVSLAFINPQALIALRETGQCYVSLPEELFDLDFPGHYFRRIKSISLSIPCIAGPYTTVNCALRLLGNNVRITTSMNSDGDYVRENDEGVPLDDDRFRSSNAPVTSVAISTGQDDSGMFQLDFRDDRYLPFEFAGVISDWLIELSTESELRQFDYSTISDVLIHVNYTAREDSGTFKEKAIEHIKSYLTNAAESSEQPLMQMLSLRNQFPNEWHSFIFPAAAEDEHVLRIDSLKERFPFFAQGRQITAMKIEMFGRFVDANDYDLIVSYEKSDGSIVTSSEITMSETESYGGLHTATINTLDANLNLEDCDVAREISLKIKRSAAADYTQLETDPPDIEDVYIVVHYQFEEE